MYWMNNPQMAMSMHDYANPMTPVEILQSQNPQNQLQNHAFPSRNDYYYYQQSEVHNYHGHAYQDLELTYSPRFAFSNSVSKNYAQEERINGLLETILDEADRKLINHKAITSRHGLHYGSLNQENSSLAARSLNQNTDDDESPRMNLNQNTDNDESPRMNTLEKIPSEDASEYPDSEADYLHKIQPSSDLPLQNNDSKSGKSFICTDQVSDLN